MLGETNFKYKIAIAVPSNRPAKIKRFVESWKHIQELREIAKMVLVYQDPVPDEIAELFDASKKIESYDGMEIKPMLQLRRHSLDLTEDCQYIITLDCDHQFMPHRPGKTYPLSSDEYYISSLEYMDNNPDVGVMTQRGYLGGVAWGYTPMKNSKNGLFENSAGGLLLRNIGKELMFPPECHNFVGVLSEPLLSYNIMSHGYSMARRFNCPNKFEVPGREKNISKTKNETYSEEVANNNSQGYIRRKFDDPTWTHSSKKYPKAIAKMIGKA